METIYCNDCTENVTLLANAKFSCACESDIDPTIGGDPIPNSWEIFGEDAEGVAIKLERWAIAERENQEQA